jgi:hypothetical protein
VISLVATTAVAGVAVGCGDDDKESSAKPAGFAIEATAQGKKLALSHPASVSAGLVSMTLKNSDRRPRGAQIVRIVGDHNSKAVVSLLEGDSAKIPEYVQDGGGVAAVKPGETKTVTQNLPGQVHRLGRSGRRRRHARQLVAWGTGRVHRHGRGVGRRAAVTAGDDHRPRQGRQGLRLCVQGPEGGHEPGALREHGQAAAPRPVLPPPEGSDARRPQNVLEVGRQGEPPLDFAKGVGTTVIDGGVAQNVELDLTAGNYAVLCFIPDRKGGKSHADKGMVEELVVK